MPETKKKKNRRELDLLDTTMSLGDHLDELRARIILALIGLVIGTILSFCFGTRIIKFIQKPYLDVVRKRTIKLQPPTPLAPADRMEAFFSKLVEAIKSDPNAPAIDPNAVEYVREIYAGTAEDPNDPNAASNATNSDYIAPEFRLTTLAPADSFVGFMKISLITGLILSSPWVFYQLWMFVAAGLYPQERRYVNTAIPFSVGLFIMGALFFLFIVAPISLRFFLGFGDLIGLSSTWTFQKYISFVTVLMLVFGLGFQTPVAIFILTRTGLVSIAALKKSRKYVFLSVFVIAAIATPPDVISQVTLAFPLYALFELGILISYISQKRREKAKQAEEKEDYQD